MSQRSSVLNRAHIKAAAVPLTARMRLLADRELGVGNFLERVHKISRRTDRPFLFAQRPQSDGTITVEPLSLDRLVQIRNAYAAWYYEAGVRKGDPVAVYVDEGLDSFLHFLALTSLGAIAALVNGRMPIEVAADYLRRIGAVGVVASADRLEALETGRPVPALRFRVDAALLPTREGQGTLPALYPYPHGDDDPVMLCHTSGTTGAPKAATFGHRQFFLGKRQRLWTFPAARRNRMLSALPQSHSAGISYLMTATLLGLPTLIVADSGGEAVHAAMSEFRPSIVVAFPQTYAELAEMELDPAATGEIHTWINTGDSAHEAHIRALIRYGRRGNRPGSCFVDGLGSSEMGMALFKKLSQPGSVDYGRCVGMPVDVVRKAAVLDDDGRELGPDQVGRLGVRTPTRTPGYWNNSELTTKSSLSGYWLTGDVVYQDRKGRFYHLDRVPDVIQTSDGPVYSLPMEEAILAGCPTVADCAVVAVEASAPQSGQVPFAAVRLKQGMREPSDLLDMLNSALARRDLPRLHHAVIARCVEDFPTGPTGKVLKRQLRERFGTVLRQREQA